MGNGEWGIDILRFWGGVARARWSKMDIHVNEALARRATDVCPDSSCGSEVSLARQTLSSMT